VYIIVQKSTGRMYIGRKNFRSLSKLNKGKQSNWRDYTSSSKSLNALLQTAGYSDFLFFAVEQYYTPGGLGWGETWSQCHVETASRDRFLNRMIESVSWKSKESISARHKARLDAIVKAITDGNA